MQANYSNFVGRSLVVNLDGVPVAAVRSKRLSMGWEEIDVTNEEEDGFRHLYKGRTTLSVSISVEGVCKAASWDKLQTAYFANELARVTVTLPDGGTLASDGAFLQSLQAGASGASYTTFSATFLLSGRIVYTRTVQGEGGYDWHEHDGEGGPPPFELPNHVANAHLEAVYENPNIVLGFGDGTNPVLVLSFGLGDVATLDIDGETDWPDGFTFQPSFWTGDPEDYNPGDWEVRFTLQSGAIDAGWERDTDQADFGTWYLANSFRHSLAWVVLDAPPAPPISGVVILIEVRNAITHTVVASCTVTMTVTADL